MFPEVISYFQISNPFTLSRRWYRRPFRCVHAPVLKSCRLIAKHEAVFSPNRCSLSENTPLASAPRLDRNEVHQGQMLASVELVSLASPISVRMILWIHFPGLLYGTEFRRPNSFNCRATTLQNQCSLGRKRKWDLAVIDLSRVVVAAANRFARVLIISPGGIAAEAFARQSHTQIGNGFSGSTARSLIALATVSRGSWPFCARA